MAYAVIKMRGTKPQPDGRQLMFLAGSRPVLVARESNQLAPECPNSGSTEKQGGTNV